MRISNLSTVWVGWAAPTRNSDLPTRKNRVDAIKKVDILSLTSIFILDNKLSYSKYARSYSLINKLVVIQIAYVH